MGHLLKLFEFASKPYYPDLSSLIRLDDESIYSRNMHQYMCDSTEVSEDRLQSDSYTEFNNSYRVRIKICVSIHKTSKRVELESPGCSGYEVNS